MLSNGDLERLIAEKRCQIKKEKIVLGLSVPADACHLQDIESKENRTSHKQNGVARAPGTRKRVRLAENGTSDNVRKTEQEENPTEIPADLERYIRRYLGIPVMLKAGEYSPNNPLLQAERGAGGDVMLGLGEYERRRNTLRKLRQQQYREYLDEQAKKKQEAKEQAERERREREEKERQREEERERARQEIEQQNLELEQKRCKQIERQREEDRERVKQENVEEQKRASVCYMSKVASSNTASTCRNKVDTGVQVGTSRPLSVAVQTDDMDLYRLSPSPTKLQLTQAERELSPRTVVDHDDIPIHPENRTVHPDKRPIHPDNRLTHPCKRTIHPDRVNIPDCRVSDPDNRPYNDNRNSHPDNRPIHPDNRPIHPDNSRIHPDNRPIHLDNKPIHPDDRPAYSESKVTYEDDRPIQPASWAKEDWDEKAEKAARRRSYEDFDERSSPLTKRAPRDRLISELRHTYMPSIFDADAIQMRNMQAEKEAAERKQFYQQELKNQILEQQRIREERKTREKMLEAAEMRRLEEQLKMLRAAQTGEVDRHRNINDKLKESSTEYERKRKTLQKEIDIEEQNLFRANKHTHTLRPPVTSRSDTNLKLPTFYGKQKRQPFSSNISETSIFNPNYDVDSYLRKNLNPKREILTTNFNLPESGDRKIVVEKALVHDRPKERPRLDLREKPKYEPTFLKNLDEIQDETPIPVLRHSPKMHNTNIEDKSNVSSSDGMRLVEDKWKVPAVQKNILKNLPKEDGKNVSILTQLGSIRRQLQLEQLRLDNMMSKSD